MTLSLYLANEGPGQLQWSLRHESKRENSASVLVVAYLRYSPALFN